MRKVDAVESNQPLSWLTGPFLTAWPRLIWNCSSTLVADDGWGRGVDFRWLTPAQAISLRGADFLPTPLISKAELPVRFRDLDRLSHPEYFPREQRGGPFMA